ncbi:MAG: response regulator transcription factor [Ferruginibacter sp.]|nr:response regulator transcription factor [Ferruginibacter sp.]
MIKIVILEDEMPAANRLFKMIQELEPDVQLMATLHSVSGAVDWFKHSPPPDILISDIQLSDGMSFEVFKKIPVECAVIFTTAFDQYAIDAFKVNSIDYLLKPVKKEALKSALEKFKKLQAVQPVLNIEKILQAYKPLGETYKNRFVVKYGEHLKTVDVQEIAYFYTEDKIQFLVTFDGRRYAIDHNLDSLERMLAPQNFFRINRQFIISIRSIGEMFAYTKGRVLVHLNPPCKIETIVSAERSPSFKMWLGGDAV